MKDKVTLTVTSLLSILLFAFHWMDEVARYIIMLLGGIFGLGVLVIHMRGTGIVGGRIANSSGVFFWVSTLIALGVTSTFSAILAARGLWSLQRGPSS